MSPQLLTTYPLGEIVSHARENVPFYGRLYDSLPEKPALSDLPVISQEEYWAAHEKDRREVLSGDLRNGIVVKSGGTTGAPKFSYFNDSEWNSLIALSCRTFEAAGLQDGDRVANMFAAGDLSASFLFANESLKWAKPKVLQLPLAFSLNFAPAARIIREFNVNVLAGFPTYLLKLIEFARQENPEGLRIDRIVYGGELFTPAQQEFLRGIFPGIQLRSGGYASVDAGLIGYADDGCATAEHRVFDGSTLVELVDEENQPIEETGQPGRVVFTSLVRQLMPLVRYPTGDRAQWVESLGATDRKFILLGRSEEAVRVAHYSVVLSEVVQLLEPFRATYGIEQFQLLSTREGLKDHLTFRLVSAAVPEKQAEGTAEILRAFALRRTDMEGSTKAGILHPSTVEWITSGQLVISPRTGKMLRVVDNRAT